MKPTLAEILEAVEAAITVCDVDLTVLYMNEKAAKNFGANGVLDLVGSNLADCHKPESVEKIGRIFASGQPNVYTISKKGAKKLIWQAPWKKDAKVAGLVEISIPLPDSMPHYDRG
ncbi:MAG TPA: hypothetical protein VN437_07070 [Rectinemataceae bacterium]|nr:hypothetical protein [Rectinemataceae bacterium]